MFQVAVSPQPVEIMHKLSISKKWQGVMGLAAMIEVKCIIVLDRKKLVFWVGVKCKFDSSWLGLWNTFLNLSIQSKLTVRSLDDYHDGVLLKHRSGLCVGAVFKYESDPCGV